MTVGPVLGGDESLRVDCSMRILGELADCDGGLFLGEATVLFGLLPSALGDG